MALLGEEKLLYQGVFLRGFSARHMIGDRKEVGTRVAT
jgi:hypothetical protein